MRYMINITIIFYEHIPYNERVMEQTLRYVCAICIAVVLLFYVHGKNLRSCKDGQLT